MARHILILDDQESMRHLLAQALKDNGFAVTTAEDGQEGLNILNNGQQNFSLILADVNMPNLNGFEFLKAVKEKNPKLPVILCTSMNEDVVELLGKEYQADGIIKKPFDLSETIKTIKQLIANKSDPSL